MLTQLLPDQISKFWPVIKYAIEEALPPTIKGEHPDKMNRILSAALSGKLDVWASYDRINEVTKFNGIVVTQILYDDASNVYNLLIYVVFAYENTTTKTWEEGYEALAKYAKSKKCTNMIAYSSVPKIVSIAKAFGADTSFTLISIPLPSSFNS
jgi:hypothetical protein